MKRGFLRVVGFSLCALPGVAMAQTTPSAAPVTGARSVTIGAQLFYDFTMNSAPKTKDADGNTIATNAFSVTRAAVDVAGRVSDRVSFRITPDITRDTSTSSSSNGSLNFRLQYAYAQVDLTKPSDRWKDTFLRLGIQQTPLIGFEEDVYRYRFQGTVFAEREGALTLSDAGVSFHAGFPSDYGDLHVGVYNGEGAFKAEPNNQKSLQVRGTVRPIAASTGAAHGLRLTGFFDSDHYLPNAARRRLATSVTFEHSHFNFGADYLKINDRTSVNASQIDGQGWSVFLTPFLHEKGNGLEGLLRVDRFTPNQNLSGRERQRTIAGIAYWFPHSDPGTAAALLLDYEELKFSGFPATPANATQQRIGVHGLIQF